MEPLSSLTINELAEGICVRAGRIAAAQAELLAWIAEFDRREGWGGPGMLSCAHWLSWRIGLSLGTAREQVRVARRLEELPDVATAFAAGQVSYSKVRALTRVADPDDGVDWVSLARSSSAAQLERIVRGVRRARVEGERADDPELAAWKVRTRKHYDRDGNLVITITTRAEYAPVVEAGLEAKRAELQRELDAQAAPDVPAPVQGLLPLDSVPAGTPAAAPDTDLDGQAPGWPRGTTCAHAREVSLVLAERWAGPADSPDQPAELPHEPSAPTAVPDVPAGTSERRRVTDGDALLALAQAALTTERVAHPDVARRRRPLLTARIDPLSGWGRQSDGELLPPTSLRTVLRSLPGRDGLVRLRPITGADLARHDLGRSQRTVSDPLRELLGTLDGERCRFPGCTRHSKLHAHHVVFWRDGGRTDLANLVLVCSRHHTLIHVRGFALRLHPDRRLTVSSADGTPVLHHPAQPWGDPAALASGPGRSVSAATLPPDHCDARMDLRYVVSVVLAQAA